MGRKKANAVVQEYNKLRKTYNDRIRYIEKIYNTNDDKHYPQRQTIQALINKGDLSLKKFGSISKLSEPEQQVRLFNLKHEASRNINGYSMQKINEFKDKVIENTRKKYGLTDEYADAVSDEQILNIVLFDDYEDWEAYQELSKGGDAVYMALTGNLDELRDRFINIARKLGKL